MKNQYITQRNKNSDRYVLSCARYVYKQSYVDTHPERIPRICYCTKKRRRFIKVLNGYSLLRRDRKSTYQKESRD